MVAQLVVRLIVAAVAFVVAAYLAVLAFGDFRHASRPGHVLQPGHRRLVRGSAIAMVAAAVAWFAVEYLQTRRLTTGGPVHHPDVRAHADRDRHERRARCGRAYALKILIYLDSVGTILVGALCGPFAGAVTGVVGNILASGASHRRSSIRRRGVRDRGGRDRDHRRAGRTRRPAPAASEHANSPARGGGVVTVG